RLVRCWIKQPDSLSSVSKSHPIAFGNCAVREVMSARNYGATCRRRYSVLTSLIFGQHKVFCISSDSAEPDLHYFAYCLFCVRWHVIRRLTSRRAQRPTT